MRFFALLQWLRPKPHFHELALIVLENARLHPEESFRKFRIVVTIKPANVVTNGRNYASFAIV